MLTDNLQLPNKKAFLFSLKCKFALDAENNLLIIQIYSANNAERSLNIWNEATGLRRCFGLKRLKHHA